jgi:cytochrome c oxidase subunit 2
VKPRQSRFVRLLLLALPLIFVGLLFSGCDALGGPQNTFAAEGEVAEKQKNLLIITIIPAFVIFVGVMLGCLFLVLRFRRKTEDEPLPKQVHGNTRLEIAWTVLPAMLLLGLAIPILILIFDLGSNADSDALPVTVYGQQFNFDFEYPEFTDSEGEPVSSPELHIPIDRQVAFDLVGRDVIHSFWVPKLAGKEDVVPGRQNEMWFRADQPGVYQGQCAEFCGEQHANMRFTVIAETDEDFQAFIDGLVDEANARIASENSESATAE